MKAIYGYSESVPLDWRSAAEYFLRLEQSEPALNVLSMVPHGQLRLAVVGLTDRRSTEDEMKRMDKLLEKALEEGAWGLSTALEYATEAGAREDEITSLCAPLGRRDDLYVCHTRYRRYGCARGGRRGHQDIASRRCKASGFASRSPERRCRDGTMP